MSKTCAICNKSKQTTEFSTNKATKDNLNSRCRKCSAPKAKAKRKAEEDFNELNYLRATMGLEAVSQEVFNRDFK